MQQVDLITRKQFLYMGCQLGGQCSLIGSLVFGVFVSLVNFVPTLWFSDVSARLDSVWQIFLAMAIIVVVSFLASFWFGIAGGGLLAGLLLRMRNKHEISETGAAKVGAWMGAAAGLALDALAILPLASVGILGHVGHEASLTQAQVNKAVLAGYLTTTFYALTAIAITALLGAMEGRQLVKTLSVSPKPVPGNSL